VIHRKYPDAARTVNWESALGSDLVSSVKSSVKQSRTQQEANRPNGYRLRWREAVRDPSTSFALLTSLRMTRPFHGRGDELHDTDRHRDQQREGVDQRYPRDPWRGSLAFIGSVAFNALGDLSRRIIAGFSNFWPFSFEI
jgi:hypothetical protein